MEKRIILAGAISLAILFAWQAFFAPPPEKRPAPDAATRPTAGPEEAGAARAGTAGPARPLPAETPDADGPRRTGEPDVAAGELVLQNEAIRVVFDAAGARVRTLQLLEHRQDLDAEDGVAGSFKLVRAVEGGDAGLALRDAAREEGWLDRVTWDTAGPRDGAIVFTLPVEDRLPVWDESGAERLETVRYLLTKTVALTEAAHRLRVSVSMRHLSGGPVSKRFFLSTSGGVFPDHVGGTTLATPHSIVGIDDGGEVELEVASGDEIGKTERSARTYARAAFVADLGVYFAVYLRHASGGTPAGAMVLARRRDDPSMENDPLAWRPWSRLGVGLSAGPGGEDVAVFDYYAGPKDHRSIKRDYEDDRRAREDYLAVADHELTATGFCCDIGPLSALISLISKAVVASISFFYGLFGNMGIAIIVLTVCVRTLLFPITRRSQVAMQAHAKQMARIKPKLDELKKKYGDDRQVFAQKQMELFKQEKVKLVPVGGCLPLFLQIPIFFGLFSAIRFDYDLRHAGFLWCEDLSQPDRVIAFADPIVLPCCIGPGVTIDGLNVFPLLMIAAMFFHQLGMPKSEDPQMRQQQKMMLFMPIFFGFMMYGYAAGLSLYWLSSSLFGIFEQRVIKRFFPVPDPEPAPARR